MSDIAVRVKNLSKCYQIYDNPQDRLKQSLIPRFQRIIGKKPAQYFREFWALKDVSFEVKKGETLGIIGRNGSGKSTLLQMICGTLTPTAGSVEVLGRVAALLELGSGFNPEFTGRENVYMNAGILGLTKKQVDERFDDIVAFADIGDFIEQPVKTYSSGMYVRLAFSVIVHVDADILVIDEALAVGDVFFTQKCMRFLRGFMERGTVIFVSHDTGAVINLCPKAIWLNKGYLKQYGAAKSVSEAYLTATLQDAYRDDVRTESAVRGDKVVISGAAAETAKSAQLTDWELQGSALDSAGCGDGWKTGVAEIRSIRMLDAEEKPCNILSGGESIILVVRVGVTRDIESPIVGFLVKDRLGQALFGENTFLYTDKPLHMLSGQTCEAQFKFTMPPLPNGEYSIAVAFAEGTLSDHVQHQWVHDALVFKFVSNRPCYGLVGVPCQAITLNIV